MTEQEVNNVIAWLNEWEQLKDTAIPLRFAEDFRPKTKPITESEKAEAVDDFIKLTVTHTVNFFRLMGFKTHIEATVLDESTGDEYEFTFRRMVQLPTEPTKRFPVGVKLTSLENGELVIANEGTPPELIVGTVTLNGLETK